MFSLRYLTKISTIRANRQCIKLAKNFHDEVPNNPFKLNPKPDNISTTSPAIASKFNVFSDDKATVILDVEEERQRIADHTNQKDDLVDDVYSGLNLERGVNGVYEIEDLVKVLRSENAQDIFVCTVPKEIKYVDYVCIVTGQSLRHRLALAEFVRKIFKLKRHEGDVLPKIEGEKSKKWLALDLGNIALHIYSEEARLQYDLESLWSVGAKYDTECNKPEDHLIDFLENSSLFLNDLTPNSRK